MKLDAVLSHRAWVLALVLSLGSVAVLGRQPAQEGGGGLTVDFTAVGTDGKPVTDLNPADISVRIGSKVRTVSALTLKRVEAAAAAPAAAAPAAATGNASPPFATNQPSSSSSSSSSGSTGRSIQIVVDTESLRAGTESAVRTAIEALLKDLTPADRVALSTAPRDTIQIGFGTGLTRVREAVAGLRGQRPASVSNADALCRTRDSLVLLTSLMEPLAGSQTPTSFVYIASGLSLAGSEQGTSGRCEVLTDNYRAVARSAAEGRVNVYVVQGDPATMGRNDGLESLAGATGAGQVLRVIEEGFAPRVLADASTYWIATIAADPSDRPGQPQRLEVRTTRENVTIHARGEFAISKQAASAQAKPGAAASAASPADMLKTTAPFTDLQLRALVYHARGEADKMTVLVMAEPVDPTVKITAMRVGFFDQSGKGGATNAPQIATYPITTALPLDAGPYRIRVAATDASGKSGAVDINIDTNLTQAGPLKLGALMFGAVTDKGMSPRLIFSGEDKIRAMFELYGLITADAKMKVGFELANSDTGPAISTFQPIGANQLQPDKFAIFGEIPIDNLAPGDYVIRGVAQLEGQAEGKVLRTFRKVAK